MKRIGLLLLLVMSAVLSEAEITHSVGLQVGFNRQLVFTNSPLKSEDKTKLEKDPLNGAKLGFVYEVNLVKGFGIFTAFNYAFTGHSSKWVETGINSHGEPVIGGLGALDYKYKAEAHTLDWNVELQYKFEIARNTHIIVYTGPSVRYLAKYDAKDFFREHYSEQGVTPAKQVYGYNAEEMGKYYQRWNVSWGIGVAFQFDRYFIRGGYDFGLVNPYSQTRFDDMDLDPAIKEYCEPGRLTRGRFDSWNIRLGVYLWQSDK